MTLLVGLMVNDVKKIILTLLLVLPVTVVSAQDIGKRRLKHLKPDMLALDTRNQIDGTWTCDGGALDATCTADGASGDAINDLDVGDIVVCDEYSYEIFSITTKDEFERKQEYKEDGITKYPFEDITSKTCYIVATAMPDGSTVNINDGIGGDSPIWIGQNIAVEMQLDGDNAATEVLALENTNEPASGETDDTIALSSYFNGTTDNGTSFSLHEAVRLEAYKASDAYHASDESDHDFGLKFYVTNGGTTSRTLQIYPDGSVYGTTTIESAANFKVTNQITIGAAYINLASDSGIAFTGDAGNPAAAKDINSVRYWDGANAWWVIDDGGMDGVGDGRLIVDTIRSLLVSPAVGTLTLSNTAFSSADNAIEMATGTDTSTTGTITKVAITPTYNQASGDAANTDLFINRTETAVGSGNQYLIDAQVDGASQFSVDNLGNVTYSAREVCHVVPAGSAILGPTAPTATTLGTFRGLAFASDSESANINWEIPGDWDDASDMTLKLYVWPESGDAPADTEVIQFDAQYRSIATGEAYDNGTAVTISPTYTQSGAGTDKALIILTVTIDYDNANQPLTEDDVIGFLLDRDFTGADTYSGDVYVERAEICYQSVGIPNHV